MAGNFAHVRRLVQHPHRRGGVAVAARDADRRDLLDRLELVGAQRDVGGAAFSSAIGEGHAHAAEAERGHAQALAAESALLHGRWLPRASRPERVLPS